jgi:hypothetical protein
LSQWQAAKGGLFSPGSAILNVTPKSGKKKKAKPKAEAGRYVKLDELAMRKRIVRGMYYYIESIVLSLNYAHKLILSFITINIYI